MEHMCPICLSLSDVHKKWCTRRPKPRARYKWRGDIVLKGDSQRLSAATFQRKSANAKLSTVLQKPYRGRFQTFPQRPFVCSTYVSIDATCPDECRFKNAGCYVQVGNTMSAMKRLDAGARARPEMHPNVLEANLIDAQWNGGERSSPGPAKATRVPQDGPGDKGRPLRLHVGGDVRDVEGAQALTSACELWLERDGGPVWTYTHRWREVPVGTWGDAISALASVETVDEAVEAVDLGYMPSFTLAEFESERAYRLGSVKVIPCPAQTRNVKCVDCRLCFKPLPKGVAIGFAWHGRGGAGKRKLEVIQLEQYGQTRMGIE